jgi:hypothetical protein
MVGSRFIAVTDYSGNGDHYPDNSYNASGGSYTYTTVPDLVPLSCPSAPDFACAAGPAPRGNHQAIGMFSAPDSGE